MKNQFNYLGYDKGNSEELAELEVSSKKFDTETLMKMLGPEANDTGIGTVICEIVLERDSVSVIDHRIAELVLENQQLKQKLFVLNNERRTQ